MNRLKLHLRARQIAGKPVRVLTLRPATIQRFATNRFHEMWHVLSDPAGAALLSRLLWGLSYQQAPGTLVYIDAPHLVPNPFDAARSHPIVLISEHLASVDVDVLRALRLGFGRLGPSDGTVGWHTPSLTRWIDDGASWGPYIREARSTRFHQVGGVLALCAPPAILREEAMRLHALSRCSGATSYDWVGDGEVQVFPDFAARGSIAAQARRYAIAAGDGPSRAGFDGRVWARGLALRDRRYRTT